MGRHLKRSTIHPERYFHQDESAKVPSDKNHHRPGIQRKFHIETKPFVGQFRLRKLAIRNPNQTTSAALIIVARVTVPTMDLWYSLPTIDIIYGHPKVCVRTKDQQMVCLDYNECNIWQCRQSSRCLACLSLFI